MMKVALICAIPQESRPILRQLGCFSRVRLGNLFVWSGASANLQLILAESGMGMDHAAEAAQNIIKFAPPDIVISTGFCGAIRPGLRRGDVILAENILTYDTALRPTSAFCDRTLLERLSPSGATTFHRGTFITTSAMVAKSQIAASLDEQIRFPVLEMESNAVAEVCNRSGIPFVAIRVVSDTAEQDPHAVCSKIFAADMKISMIKLLKAIVTAPLITRDLIRLAIDATAAGTSLAQTIEFSLGKLR